MSLDVYLERTLPTVVFEWNITHNLTAMASEAGIYKHLWRPDEIGITHARELIDPLERGLFALRLEPDRFRQYEPDNGWGTYGGLVDFVERYIEACRENPDASVRVSR